MENRLSFQVEPRKLDSDPADYVSPQIVELGTLTGLTATGHYTLIGGGDLPVLSSITG